MNEHELENELNIFIVTVEPKKQLQVNSTHSSLKKIIKTSAELFTFCIVHILHP